MNILTVSEHSFCDELLPQYPTIVDFGANKGWFMDAFLQNHKAKYIAVEATPSLCDDLQNTYAGNPDVVIINAVASYQNNVPTTFFVDDEHPYASSTIFNNDSRKPITVNSISLSEILKTYKHIDLLKVDIEGSEWEIFEWFNKGLYDSVDQISVEFHDFLDVNLRQRTEGCIKILTELGYRMFGEEYHNLLFYKPTMLDISKDVFQSVVGWEGGYREDWENVYGKLSGQTIEVFVAKCLEPFYDKNKVCLEIGCGQGFWTDRLAENFKDVIAIDVLSKDIFDKIIFKNKNIRFIELPDRNFDCYGIEDNSIDFIFSFGVFCHLSLDANQQYLNAMFKKLKKGGQVSLFYSNNDRRVIYKENAPQWYPNHTPMWCKNDYPTTQKMLANAGFENIYDLMPELFDTIICGTKI